MKIKRINVRIADLKAHFIKRLTGLRNEHGCDWSEEAIENWASRLALEYEKRQKYFAEIDAKYGARTERSWAECHLPQKN